MLVHYSNNSNVWQATIEYKGKILSGFFATQHDAINFVKRMIAVKDTNFNIYGEQLNEN